MFDEDKNKKDRQRREKAAGGGFKIPPMHLAGVDASSSAASWRWCMVKQHIRDAGGHVVAVRNFYRNFDSNLIVARDDRLLAQSDYRSDPDRHQRHLLEDRQGRRTARIRARRKRCRSVAPNVHADAKNAGQIAGVGQIECRCPERDVVRTWSEQHRAVFDLMGVAVLVFLHPADQDGGQGRVELWQKQGADARQGSQ